MRLIWLALLPAALLLTEFAAAQGEKTRMSALPESVSMIMFGVENVARSAAFYRDVVGFKIQSESPEFAFVAGGTVTIGLNLPLGKSVKPLAGATELILPVASVTASKTLLAGRGAKFTVEPREVTPGTFASTFTDPDGHRLTLLGKQ